MTRGEFLTRMQAFLAAAEIRHFRAWEVCDAGRGRRLGDGRVARLSPPPAGLWGNALPTLRVLEWLRARAGGHPLHVSSGYRDAAYNHAVGGQPRSLHVACNAFDVQSAAVPAAELAAMLLEHPEARRTGVGLYGGFVHVDTRGALGRSAPARWGTGERWWT